MLTLLQAVDFLRERLHKSLVAGSVVTAKSPFTPQPVTDWTKIVSDLLNNDSDLLYNQDGTPNANKKSNLETLFKNVIEQHFKLEEGLTTNSILNLPITRLAFPALIANEIVGVQPIKHDIGIGQIHTLRVQYSNRLDMIPPSPFTVAKKTTGNLPEDALALETQIRSLINQFEQIIAREKFKNDVLEGTQNNKLSIQIMKEVVEARSKYLSACYTFPENTDENEVYRGLASEVVAECDAELLGTLRDLPGCPTCTFDMAQARVDAENGPPTFIGDVQSALAILINRQANLIATRTRRGAGNWCVVSPTVLTILKSATSSAFSHDITPSKYENPIVSTKFVGTLNNAMRVYVDEHADDTTPVLVGYKGNDIDAAAFYCPWHFLTINGVTIDPTSFEPVVRFITRYGFFAMSNAADYLGLVGINPETATSFI